MDSVSVITNPTIPHSHQGEFETNEMDLRDDSSLSGMAVDRNQGAECLARSEIFEGLFQTLAVPDSSIETSASILTETQQYLAGALDDDPILQTDSGAAYENCDVLMPPNSPTFASRRQRRSVAQQGSENDAVQCPEDFCMHSDPRSRLRDSTNKEAAPVVSAEFKEGEIVEVQCKGDWWLAWIQDRKEGQFRIRYLRADGSKASCSWVQEYRIRPKQAEPATSTKRKRGRSARVRRKGARYVEVRCF
jgi:hypothetical protein